MATEITVPQFPESVSDGTILAWRKQPGDNVSRGDIIADIETDKVVFEVPAPADGVIAEIGAPMVAPGDRAEKRVPMTRLRARIAERLVEAQHTAAILTTFNEVNMQPIMELRKKYADKFEKAEGVKLGFMSFFVKAAVEALKRFPEVNASIDGNDIVYHGFFDVGIAVGSPRGLVVPIMRDADQVSMAEVEKTIKDFG